MQRNIKGFLFDLDGTLVDTAEANYWAYHDAIYKVCGVKISKKEFANTNGMVYKDFLPILIPNIEKDEIEKVSKYKKETYKIYLHHTKPNIFLIDFLKHMADDYVITLVTTAKKQNATAVLRKHGLTKLFDYQIFGEDVSKMKPNPEAYLLALKITNLKADEVIAFEDSETGIKAANGAGIQTIHVRSFL